MARRQETRPQCLRPHPRGVRGEAEGADCGDKSRAGRIEETESEHLSNRLAGRG